MPKQVTAQAGDTLCGLAVAAGFIDCDPLRAEAANAAFLNRDLVAGDVVTIPDIELREETKSSGATHTFVAQNAPPFSIRFTHGSPDKHYRDDDTLTFLNLSNYRTDKAGADGLAALPTASVFDARGHADPDTFKVEVVDPAAGGTVNVKLEAMKPILAADGTVTGHEPFDGSAPGNRTLNATCKKVSSGVCFRSPYLRLVADDVDQGAVAAQTLLVTDVADGNAGTNDKIEILDQEVRASYLRTTCPAGKCTARVQVPLAPDRMRIRVAFHVFRANAGDATGIAGVTDQLVRRRLFKWFRRVYAQAGLAPKLVANTEFLDPPRANMLVISQDHGRAASGVNAAGGASSIKFNLASPLGSPAFPEVPAGGPDPSVTVAIPAGTTPAQAGALVAGALPANFAAQVFPVARAFNAPNPASDILITRTDGLVCIIRAEVCDDTRMTVSVPRVSIANVFMDGPADTLVSQSDEMRRVVRASPGTGDRLEFYVVGNLVDAAGTVIARGVALVPGFELTADFQSVAPIRWSALIGLDAGGVSVLSANDNSPYSFPHESGHVLNDAFHTDAKHDRTARFEMMRAGTSGVNELPGSKRICDAPKLVRYDRFDIGPGVQAATPGKFFALSPKTNATQRMREKGAPVMEAW